MVSNRKDVVCKLPCKAGWQRPDRGRELPKALIAAEATDVLHQRVPGREQTAMAALSLGQSRTVKLPFGNISVRSLYG